MGIGFLSAIVELGSLGIPDLRSLALLNSWIFRYHLQSNSIWTKIVDHKYKTNRPNVLCCADNMTSPFGKGWCGLYRLLKRALEWKVGRNGEKIVFDDGAVWILLITRMKTRWWHKVTKCIRVVVLLGFKAFSVCGWRANTLKLNCLERFMINIKRGKPFLFL